MFEKFSSQKSDDVFVEAAINPNARQEYIDKLVKSRVVLIRLLTFTALVFAFSLAIDLFMPSSSTRSSFSQSLSIFNLVALGFTTAALLVTIVSNDLGIKFLKALEASAKQVTQTEI